jgi:hypothetical protein
VGAGEVIGLAEVMVDEDRAGVGGCLGAVEGEEEGAGGGGGSGAKIGLRQERQKLALVEFSAPQCGQTVDVRDMLASVVNGTLSRTMCIRLLAIAARWWRRCLN